MTRLIIQSYKFNPTNDKDLYGNTYYTHSSKNVTLDLPTLEYKSSNEFTIDDNDLDYLIMVLKNIKKDINLYWNKHQKFGVAFYLNLKQLVFKSFTINDKTYELKTNPVTFTSPTKQITVTNSTLK